MRTIKNYSGIGLLPILGLLTLVPLASADPVPLPIDAGGVQRILLDCQNDLKSPEPAVREAAYRSLAGLVGHEEAVSPLIRGVSDREESVRRTAVLGLAGWMAESRRAKAAVARVAVLEESDELRKLAVRLLETHTSVAAD